jgi:O-methyltransferase
MIKKIIRAILRIKEPIKDSQLVISDIEDSFLEIYEKCKNYTMTSIERMYALYKATEYIVRNEIPGDIVECGVWKGGSMMLIAYILKKFGDYNRDLYLFDTFEGMPSPGEKDISYDDIPASILLSQQERNDESSIWSYAPLEEVEKNMLKVGYNNENIHFIKGKVEDTLADNAPECISLLRLDTDWYESTRHELLTLFPRICTGGVIIIDDYGHWRGARQAVDDYIRENNVKILLNRIDYTGRIGVVIC